jgi:hypothetical protein
MASNQNAYPVTLSIDYSDRALNRLTSFFRIFTAIPIALILSLLTDSNAGVLICPTLLMILFRQKYPKWWFEWNLNVTKFSTRVCAYLVLLTDVCPSTDEEQSIHIQITYPDVKKDLNRWLPLVKWFLAIPHYFCLGALSIAFVVIIIIAWFAILFTGRFPRSMFDFCAGYLRWLVRVEAYAFLLTTDKYPPFSLD